MRGPRPQTKRIVVQHTQGPLAGLWRIMGTTAEFRKGKRGPLPAFVEPVDFVTHKGAASLVVSKPRYVLYRELMPPTHTASGGKHTFHPSQA